MSRPRSTLDEGRRNRLLAAVLVMAACKASPRGSPSGSAADPSPAPSADAPAPVWSSSSVQPKSVCFADDRLLVIEDNTVSRLDAATGTIRWTTSPAGTAAFVDDTCSSVSLLTASPTEAVLSEISLSDGKVSSRISVALSGPRSYGWFRRGEKLYGMHYHHVTQIDAKKASVDWTREVGAPQLDWIRGPELLSDRLLVECGESQGLCSFAVSDGSFVDETGRKIVDFAVAGGDEVVVLEESTLVRERRLAGAPKSTVWSVPTEAASPFGTVSVHGDSILAVAGKNRLTVHAAANGQERLRLDSPSRLYGSEVTLAGAWLLYPSFEGERRGLVARRVDTPTTHLLVPMSSKSVVTTEFADTFNEHLAFKPVVSGGRVLVQKTKGPLQLLALPVI